SLVHFELDRLVFTLRILVGVRLTVWLELASKQSGAGRSLREAGAAQNGAEGILLVVSYERSAAASCWKSGAIRCDRGSQAEGDFVGIHENVRFRVGIADEVVQLAAVACKGVKLLHRNAALVFDYAL